MKITKLSLYLILFLLLFSSCTNKISDCYQQRIENQAITDEIFYYDLFSTSAMIGGKERYYDLATDTKKERAGFCYIGKGYIYTVNGVRQGFTKKDKAFFYVYAYDDRVELFKDILAD